MAESFVADLLIGNGRVALETQMDALEDDFAVADMRTNKSDAFFPVIFFLLLFYRFHGE